jgi:hypothetical protein
MGEAWNLARLLGFDLVTEIATKSEAQLSESSSLHHLSLFVISISKFKVSPFIFKLQSHVKINNECADRTPLQQFL